MNKFKVYSVLFIYEINGNQNIGISRPRLVLETRLVWAKNILISALSGLKSLSTLEPQYYCQYNTGALKDHEVNRLRCILSFWPICSFINQRISRCTVLTRFCAFATLKLLLLFTPVPRQQRNDGLSEDSRESTTDIIQVRARHLQNLPCLKIGLWRDCFNWNDCLVSLFCICTRKTFDSMLETYAWNIWFISIIYDVVYVDVHCIFLWICSPEIRTEAVTQALAMNKKQSMAPMPSKRTSAGL